MQTRYSSVKVKIPGHFSCRIFYAENLEKVYRQADHPPVEMSNIPIPRYDLISKYRYPVIYIQATRGCPHDCEFCVASNIYGTQYRHKTVEQVVREFAKCGSIGSLPRSAWQTIICS